MLTLTLVASVLACSAATAWNNDPWPAASQARPATVRANNDPWPGANQARPAAAPAYSGNPDDFWWNKQASNPFDNAAAHPQSAGSPARAPGSYQTAGSPVRRQQAASPSFQAGGGAAPGRAIVSVSRSGSGTPHVTGVRRVSSAAAGVSQGAASVASVSGQYIPPGAGSQPRPQQVIRGSTASAGSGRLPSRHQSSGSSGSFAPHGSGSSGSSSFAAPSSGSHSSVSPGRQQVGNRPQPSRFNSGQYVAPRPSTGSRPGQSSGSSGQFSGSSSGSSSRPGHPGRQQVGNRPQPSRFNSGQYVAPRPSTGSRPGQFSGSSGQFSGSSGQFSGSSSGPSPGQYAGSVSGSLGGSGGAQGPVVKSCGASLFCVDTNACDPYTGFLMDPSQGPIPQLDQPTVAFTRCYMSKNRAVGVCCQEPHINDPWTDRTTNGR